VQHVHYIAGASGVGTSTRAHELQREWDARDDGRATYRISTDVVRAELRAVLARETHPDLYGESFDLAMHDGDLARDGVSIDAFLRQCEPILRAVEAGVEHALREGWNVIVEGVHLMPGAYAAPDDERVRVTQELLVVHDDAAHVDRFQARDRSSGGRRAAAHYVANLDRIRAIQAELVDRGDRT
jgi:2-phosphoglycerate kinase